MKQHPSFLARQAKARLIAAAFERDQHAEDAPHASTAPEVDAKRQRMLRDIMITAFEGGSNYWAEARRVVRDEDEALKVDEYAPGSLAERTGRHYLDYVSFEVRSFEDREDKRLGKWHLIDAAAVDRGLLLIVDNGRRPVIEAPNPVSVRRDIWVSCVTADKYPEEADLDAEAADCILQAAAFGEIVYG